MLTTSTHRKYSLSSSWFQLFGSQYTGVSLVASPMFCTCKAAKICLPFALPVCCNMMLIITSRQCTIILVTRFVCKLVPGDRCHLASITGTISFACKVASVTWWLLFCLVSVTHSQSTSSFEGQLYNVRLCNSFFTLDMKISRKQCVQGCYLMAYLSLKIVIMKSVMQFTKFLYGRHSRSKQQSPGSDMSYELYVSKLAPKAACALQ